VVEFPVTSAADMKITYHQLSANHCWHLIFVTYPANCLLMSWTLRIVRNNSVSEWVSRFLTTHQHK